jgi:hypothetical protein
MSYLDNFLQSPWKSESLNEKYTRSFLHLSPLPEFSTGEILLASLYRNVGFEGEVSEKKTPSNGNKLKKNLENRKRPGNREGAIDVDGDLWEKIVKKSISSPKQINQSKKQFLQLSPIVPDATIYSMAARLAGNPWNPGKLIAKMIVMGAQNKVDALALWQDVYEHLSVTDDDDIWARLIQKELITWREQDLSGAWHKPESLPVKESQIFENLFFKTPASHFVRDLKSILSLKSTLTRRQWISMLESLCRIAACSQVMWTCSLNGKLSSMFEQALRDGDTFEFKKVLAEIELNECFWALEHPTGKIVEEIVRSYVLGRCSINLILSQIFDNSSFKGDGIDLTTAEGITKTLNYLARNKEYFDYTKYRADLKKILEFEPRITACKKGSSKNIVEFISHVVRQRQTSEAGLESYDQGYYLRKKAAYSKAPWVVSLGPAALLMMVHCSVARIQGPATVANLIEQLARYGLEADIQQGKNSEFYRLLRNLGLVVESPDAEGGMVINSPFRSKMGA